MIDLFCLPLSVIYIMNALLEGEEVDLPTFDFIRGIKIFGRRRTKLTEGQPIVIEGIHEPGQPVCGRSIC